MPQWLIKNLLLLAILSSMGCRSEANLANNLKKGLLRTPWKELIHVELALTKSDQAKGLSGRKKGSLKPNQGMLFLYREKSPKSFWMPDTYFDLDIIFLDKDLKILNIQRKVPHHPGRDEPPAIARTPAIMSRHILELPADSKISKKLRVGQQFKWGGETPLLEIISKTHHGQ
ncbi:MAG: uncharacterized membrane protein (UPF0127 family) [Bacteriovoracaceae bacterium]|jgi:uncharacterized membrane protein (UPF0127 family)